MDKYKLHDKLTNEFMIYQHRLDNPFPNRTESPAVWKGRYLNDVVFRNRVDSLVCGVMHIVEDFMDSESPPPNHTGKRK